MIKFLLSALLLLQSFTALSATDSQPLPLENAFAISAELFGHDTILVHWKIAPGYYLYRDRFSFQAIQPSKASIGHILYPLGIIKEDELLGKHELYTQLVTIPIPLINSDLTDTTVKVNYQGCAEDGYCYPPTVKLIHVNLAAGTTTISTPVDSEVTAQEQPYANLLANHHLITILLGFLGFGVLLSFTPCVLPMLPILSGIIVGHQKTMTPGKSFRLSLVYVLSMAVTYAIAGVLVGFLGSSVQSIFQKPWVLALFSLLFVLLALSLFGLYQIKLPARLQGWLAYISRHQKSGHYWGVVVMGSLATLIVSPCVTPALVGVLSYIGQTGNAVLGGLALFFMGLGMGLPLMAIGIAGGKLLPKAGTWMTTLEYVFGVLFLGMAIWMLQRIIPGEMALALWALLLIITSIYLGALSSTPTYPWGKLWKGLGIVLLVYGVVLLIGAAQGNSNMFQPLRSSTVTSLASTQENAPVFTKVQSLADIEQAIRRAKTENKPLLLDFYADWCISCQEMEQTTFKDLKVRAAMRQVIALQADVTANNATDKKLLTQYGVVAPPTMVWLQPNGQVMKSLTLVGKANPQEFLTHLEKAIDTH